MVGISIQNHVNQNDKPIGISVRRKHQLSGEMTWSSSENVSQSNARCNASDILLVTCFRSSCPSGLASTQSRSGQTALRNSTRKVS